MSHIIANIENFLKEKNANYEIRFDAENNFHLFIIHTGTDNGKFSLLWRVFHEYSQMVLLGLLPVNVPENKRYDMIYFLNQLNSTFKIGNFELDTQDGEIRFRYGFYFDPDLPFKDNMVLESISLLLMMLDQKMSEIMGRIYGTESSNNNLEPKTQSALPFWYN